MISDIVDNDTPRPGQITAWLTNWRQGDSEAAGHLFATVYPQLREIASRLLRRERPNHTLDPNALVHELCLQLFGRQTLDFRNRAHFFAIAAQSMRRILIDYARARVTNKRGGELNRVTLSSLDGHKSVFQVEDLVALDTALTRLEQNDPRAAQIVELRFFGGLTEEDIAEVLNVSVTTVERDWKTARAWLMTQILPNQ